MARSMTTVQLCWC